MKKFNWQGRIDDSENPLSRRIHQVIKTIGDNEVCTSGFVLIGYASDIGVVRNQGRPGAKEGPDAIRSSLSSLPYAFSKPIYDYGNVDSYADDLEALQSEFADKLSVSLQQGHCPIALGGGHDIAYAHYNGIKQYLSQKNEDVTLGIINVDAHLDIRPLVHGLGNSGTSFYQILEDEDLSTRYLCFGFQRHANTQELIKYAKKKHVVIIDQDELMDDYGKALQELKNFMQEVDLIYLTIDLDALSAAICPGVSAPNGYGLQVNQVRQVIDAVGQSGKLISADLAECNPTFDVDNHTARTAAFLVYRMMERWKLR